MKRKAQTAFGGLPSPPVYKYKKTPIKSEINQYAELSKQATLTT